MNIIFTRHGESEANVARIISNRDLPHPLTPKGERQARQLAEKLAAREIGAIYASPILRAQQTAQILAERLDMTVQSADALREFDCGVMEGRGDAEAWQAHDAVIRAWDDEGDYGQRIPGGESFDEMRARFVPFVEQVRRQSFGHGQDVVLVSHGSLLHRMLPIVLSNVALDFSKTHPLGNCAQVITAPQSDHLTCLEWDGYPFTY